MNSSPSYGSLLAHLTRIQRSRIDSEFEDLLSRKINIAPGIRSIASDSQSHLRDFLKKEESRDSGFPHVLSNADSDFLGGSFGRHTKNWPLDDIDLYVPLDGQNLFYVQNGIQLPYTVQSDGGLRWNPLLTERWANGSYVSSTKLIWEFSSVLARHYRESEVRPNGNCVSVRLKQCATPNSDGLGYDVVPCFSLKPHLSSEFEFYLIPDGNGGWVRTNPRLDADVCDILQAFHNGIYRKVVKLLKFWNETQLSSKFSSYYVEFAVCREFWKRKSNGGSVGKITEGLAVAFEALGKAFQVGNQTSWIAGAPAIRAPQLTTYEAASLSLAGLGSGLAWINETLGKESEARTRWASIFGKDF